MAYQTSLMHLNNEDRVAGLIRAGMLMTLPFNAHLTGLYVVPHVPVRSPHFPALSGAIVQSGLDAYRKSGERIHQVFEAAAKRQPVTPEWRLYEPRHDGYAEAVLAHARSADLLVVSQKEAEWAYADMFDIPDVLALESGRPVLVVPRKGELRTLGERVLVAWNNSRESARAVFDAMPVLQKAKETRVLCISESGKAHTQSELASVELCAALSRHGVNCVADHVKPTERGERGELLLTQARSHG